MSDWSSGVSSCDGACAESPAHATRKPFDVISTPPTIAVAAFTASRRFIGGMSAPRSQVLLSHLADRVIHGAGCERHVQNRRALIAGRRHACAVGDEDIGAGVRLVRLVERRRLRIAAHAYAAHLVDVEARGLVVVAGLDVVTTGDLEHRLRFSQPVPNHLLRVVVVPDRRDEPRNPPLILLRFVQADKVRFPLYGLTRHEHEDTPRSRLRLAVLVCHAEALNRRPAPLPEYPGNDRDA